MKQECNPSGSGDSSVILWSNDSGVKTGTLTLSDSLSNYSYLQLDIEAVDGATIYGRAISNKYHVSCFSSNSNLMRALILLNSQSWYGIMLGAISLSKQSDTSLSIAQNFYIAMVANGNSDGSNINPVARRQSGNCKLYKIIGIK